MFNARIKLGRLAFGIGAWVLATWAYASPILYGINDGANALVTIDRTTGAVSTVGNTGVATGEFGDLTYDSNHDILFWSAGRGNGGLYTIDRGTGVATLIGATGITDPFGLAYDTANNTLYGSGSSGFYRINAATGLGTQISGSQSFTVGGLAYRPDTNTMYELVASTGQLNIVDVTTGALTVFSAGAGSIDDDGISWDPLLGGFWVDEYSTGNVYFYNAAFTSRQLVGTASGTRLDGVAFVNTGPTPIAEPEPIAMLVIGGLGAWAVRRRRRSA